MVNFHALCRFTELCGGWTARTPRRDGFKCFALAFNAPLCASRSLRFRQEWKDSFEGFGPEDFAALQRRFREDASAPGTPSLRAVLAVLRLSRHDPAVFLKYGQALLDRAPNASIKLQGDAQRDVEMVLSNVYMVRRSGDVFFEAGRFFMGVRAYERAIDCFERSHDQCGEHYVNWYNRGICLSYLEKHNQALASFDRCLALRPDYSDADMWRRQICKRLG
jgi:tetratricopeptide (TPR) repeat protein